MNYLHLQSASHFNGISATEKNVYILLELAHKKLTQRTWSSVTSGVWNRVCRTQESCFGSRLPNYDRQQNCLRGLPAWTGTSLSPLFERKTAQKYDFPKFLRPSRTAGAII